MAKRKGQRIPFSSGLEFHSFLALLAALSAAVITIFVLFYPPRPGVADQGDFQRVMSVTGLTEISSDSTHWFRYVKTQYKMTPLIIGRLMGQPPTTSMIYPISAARVICRLTGSGYFNTRILALVYMFIYIISLYICLKCIDFKRTATSIFFCALSVLILADGNYSVWFNSLYGEPMMITSLLLFIASLLYASRNINLLSIIFIFISAYLFLGAKLQCFSALPLVVLILVRIVLLSGRGMNRSKIVKLFAALISIFILISYVKGIYKQISSSCGVDTIYNSVFYGILKESKDPVKDLKRLGLSPDLAVDAGKHAYLPREQYIKYVPWSQLTMREFNQKMNNFKLLKFYLLQPERLLKGMEYTASRCFDTMSSLGKYEKSSVKEYIYKFRRFTAWSDFRSSLLPKSLAFLIAFYIAVLTVIIIEYRNNKGNNIVRFRIEILFTIMMIGLLQFPMPFIGNGEADTSKQLFLFNYTFDIVFLCAASWIFDKIYTLFICNKA